MQANVVDQPDLAEPDCGAHHRRPGDDIDGFEAIERYRPYMAAQLAAGVPLNAMTRHMLGLFHGWPGARAWRRILSVEAAAKGAGLEVLDRALEVIREGQERAAERLTAAG